MRRPRFIAEQARHAKGPLGRLIAFIMAGETWSENLRAIDALDIDLTDHVLDIGCGHGRSLKRLAEQASRGHVTGVDPSDLMLDIARARNRDCVRNGRVDLAVSTAADLPFADARFDKALCIHVVYFWRDVPGSLRSIARVMKPGGQLALIFHSSANAGAVRSFPSDIYRFPSLGEVEIALAEAGFSVRDASAASAPKRPHLIVATRLHASQLGRRDEHCGRRERLPLDGSGV